MTHSGIPLNPLALELSALCLQQTEH